KVAALTQGVLQAMLLTKLKIATAILALAGVIALAGGALSHGAPTTKTVDGSPPNAQKADKPRTDQELLQGTWDFFSVTSGDKAVKKTDLADDAAQWKSLTFTGDKVLCVNINTGGTEVEYNCRVALD